MVDRIGRREDHVVMAVLADIGCQDMSRVLADGLNTVMTADAIANDIDMIEVGR